MTFLQLVEEYEILNNQYIKNTLWTIMGEIAGKARGTIILSIDEASYLLTLLIGKRNIQPITWKYVYITFLHPEYYLRGKDNLIT